ncbi:MAG: NPP1 family protein [Chloroflexi bacterium]|nr:NPP1 family protein [Chloroflexota bacterium]
MTTAERVAARTVPGDLELLRRFEPIVCFTRGEEFLPTDTDWYVRQSSLWVSHDDGRRELLVEEASLDLDRLAQQRPAQPGDVLYMMFSDPLNLAELSAFIVRENVRRLRDRQHGFHADVARLARVGYASRLLDALFSVTLLLRGRVPGDAAAAALLTCRNRPHPNRHHTYYGRVVREHGWIALQYWFFYPFNNWRSGFYGANDHEADWESIVVYLYERANGEVAPAWVAYGSHDFAGDDLRRAWDDTAEVERVGDHPVVYAAAGSHAAYFQAGEYVAEVDVPYLYPLARWSGRLAQFWSRSLGQTILPLGLRPDMFRVPFVDYARGDGVTIGPDQRREWTPILLDPVPRWVSQYRGLWGYFARDPAAGENAPSGPMYRRDGAVRRAWYDPVGWAGLDKVPTPAAEPGVLRARTETLAARQAELAEQIAAHADELNQLGAELAALQTRPHLAPRLATLQGRIRALRAEVDGLRRERAQGEMLLQALAERRIQLARRPPGAVTAEDERRAHIRRLARPASPADLRLRRVMEVWAATSVGLLLVGIVALIVAAPQHLVAGIVAMIGTLVVVEAAFRRQLAGLVSTVSIALAVVAVGVLVYEFAWQIVVLGVLAAGLFVLWENVRELRA